MHHRLRTDNDFVQLLQQGLHIANQAVIADIQSECHRVDLAAPPYPGTWWDTRPMLDPREHAPDIVDMATLALKWAKATGLIAHHPGQPHLVCIFDPTA